MAGEAEAAARAAKRSFGFDALIVAFSRVMTRGSTFLTGVVIARVLGAEGRGLLAALTVPTAITTAMAELGVRESAAYHIGRKIFTPRQVAGTLLTALPLAAAISVAASLLYFQFTGISPGDWVTRLLAVALIPFALGIAYVSGILLGTNNIALFARANWVPSVIGLATVCVVTWGFGGGVRGALLGTAMGTCFGFFYALHVMARDVPIRLGIDIPVLKSVQRLGLTYAAASLALLLNFKIMILLLTQMAPLAQVGIYAQAAAIAEMLWEVPMMVSSLLFSRSASASRREEMSRKILTFARLAFLFVVGIATVIGLLSRWIFQFVYGREFVASAPVCVALLPGVVAFVVYRIIQTDMHGRGLARYSVLVIVPMLTLNLVLGYLMIGRYGAMGAAIASSMTYIIGTIAYVVIYSRLFGVTLTQILQYTKEDFDVLTNALPKRFRKMMIRKRDSTKE